MENFSELLLEADLSMTQFSRLLCVQPGTVYGWRGDPPGYALAYLRLYIHGKRNAEFIAALKEVLE